MNDGFEITTLPLIAAAVHTQNALVLAEFKKKMIKRCFYLDLNYQSAIITSMKCVAPIPGRQINLIFCGQIRTDNSPAIGRPATPVSGKPIH